MTTTRGMAVSILAIAWFTGAATRAEERSPAQTVSAALERLEFGDYEGTVTLLQPLVDTNATSAMLRDERIEALRAYGIACAMTHRRASAEGAFALLIKEEPGIRFDPNLVRPEAVELLDTVRARFFDISGRLAQRPRKLTREAKGGIALIAVGGGLATAAVISDATALQQKLQFGGNSWQYYGEYVALVATGTAVILTGVGIGLLVHALKR